MLLEVSEQKINNKIYIILIQDFVVQEWWPNGYGAQHLYQLYAFFTSSDGRTISAKKLTIGFKTVELVQDFVSGDPKQGVNCLLYKFIAVVILSIIN